MRNASSNDQAETQYNDVLSDQISLRANPELLEIHVPLSFSGVFQYLCDTMYETVEAMSHHEPKFSHEELNDVVEYLLTSRAAYCFGMKLQDHPKDIEYPSMFGPILAAIGVHTDDLRNVRLRPCPADFVDFDPKTQIAKAKTGVKIAKPTCFEKVIANLRSLGVPTSFGLPMDKTTPTDEFYRVEMADELLSGNSSTPPSPVSLFARTLVEMTYLETLFGSSRIAYTSTGTMRLAIRNVVARNINGPHL